MKNDALELVFIPSPGVGHLVSTVEFAKLLVGRDDRLSITVLVMKLPTDRQHSADPTQSLSSAEERIHFVYLPDHDQVGNNNNPKPATSRPVYFLLEVIARQKNNVRDYIVSNRMMSESDDQNGQPRLVGFVVDMFCTPMIDVANEFGVPTYVFFTSNSATLGLMFHLENLRDYHNQDYTELFHDTGGKCLSTPVCAQPIPAELLAAPDQHGHTMTLNIAKRFRDCKGILINTFAELESHALNSLLINADHKIPPVYPVGPVLNLDPNGSDGDSTIMRWLDGQPHSSVVFLCFGSMGCFKKEQVIEIAHALESSGHRFLWSLRRRPAPGDDGKVAAFQPPGEYEDFGEVLPEGFLERTAEIGKVIGWAPQVAVLSHPATGGFVSHCGWNSTLESLWFGVPMATWPLYAEQPMNAFQLVRELGLAVEIKLDSSKDDSSPIVTAAEIETGIRKLMVDTGIRQKVKEMSKNSRIATTAGGSSYNYLERFIEDVINL